MSKWFPWSKTYTIICPDGTSRIIYKNIDDAFPLNMSGFETKMSGKFGTEDIKNLEIDADYKTKVENLLFGLDDINKDLMLTFRSAYMAYVTDPCTNSQYLTTQIEKITFEHSKLKKHKLQINSLVDMLKISNGNSSEVIMNTYCNIINEMGLNGECQKEIIVREMQLASEDAKRLSGENDER